MLKIMPENNIKKDKIIGMQTVVQEEPE